MSKPRAAEPFVEILRRWWSFNNRQEHTNSWHTREDFIEKKLPELATRLATVINASNHEWETVDGLKSIITKELLGK